MKNKTVALVLSVLLGGLGIDRFYLGYTGMGMLKLLTGGCLGVLWIIDIIFIAQGKLQPADGSPYEEDAAKQNGNQDPFWGYSTQPAHSGMPQGVKQSVDNVKAQKTVPRRCQNCGAALSDGSNFCGSCGTKYVAPTTTHCAKCGAEMEEFDSFCPVCGSRQEKKAERLCMYCGKTFSENYAFCPHCGKEYVEP